MAMRWRWNGIWLRARLNRHPLLTTFVSFLVLLAAMGVLVLALALDDGPPGRYYYDLASGRLFVAPGGEPPPIAGPSGRRRGVVAHVYGCGGCPGVALAGMDREAVEARGAFIHYVESYTPDAVRAVAAADSGSIHPSPESVHRRLAEALRGGVLVGTAADLETGRLRRRSPALERRLLETLEARCSDKGEPVRCHP